MSGSGLTLHTPTITRYKIPGGGGRINKARVNLPIPTHTASLLSTATSSSPSSEAQPDASAI